MRQAVQGAAVARWAGVRIVPGVYRVGVRKDAVQRSGGARENRQKFLGHC